MDEQNNLIEKAVELTKPALTNTKKWTIKKVLLYIVTLYFVLLILKFIAKLLWKALDWFRHYIHDLTDEKKIGEVVIWTIFGIVLGVLLYSQIISLLHWINDLWKNTILPWIGL